MLDSRHSGIHRTSRVQKTVGIYVSLEIVDRLPLYCRDIGAAQARIAAIYRRAGYVVVHNQVYAPTAEMSTYEVDLIVLVTPAFPANLIPSIPYKTHVISYEDGDVSLYDVVRSRSLYDLVNALKCGRWTQLSEAKGRYKDPLPFLTACEIAVRLGYVERKGRLLRLGHDVEAKMGRR